MQADDWQDLHGRLTQLATRQKEIVRTTRKDFLSADCSFVDFDGDCCVLPTLASAKLELRKGPDELLRAEFETLATAAGKALGCPKDVQPLKFWLYHLFMHLRETESKHLWAPDQSTKIGIATVERAAGFIKDICEASALFCSRLERQALEQTGELTTPKGSHAQNIHEGRHEATPDNKFVRDGDVWCISYGDETVQLPHLVGLEYIAMLLRDSGKSIACTAILGLSSTNKPVIPSRQPSHDDLPKEEIDQPVLEGEKVGDILDERAMDEYKKRARILKEQIEDTREGRANWDINEKMAELEYIETSLRKATNRKGRSRKFSNDEEKARLAVKNAIDRALERIAINAPKACTHLKTTIQTGTSAIYTDVTTIWKL
jgi:hypothetical protein